MNLPNPSAALERAARLTRSRRARVGCSIALGFGGAVVAALTIRHFVDKGWPLTGADPWLVAAAAGLLVGAYALKALGWRRLFARHERPSPHALAAAGGAASVTGVALPGRFDDVVRIAVVRRFRGSRCGIGAIGLSLVLVALVDTAALVPLASVAAGLGHASTAVRIGLVVVASAGVAAALLVVFLPRVVATARLARFRVARWVREHSTACPREASKAWMLVSGSWALRAVALYLLLLALGLPASFGLALLFLCASAASAALPIAPAGAATQAGAGAAILALSGMGASRAVAFAIAAQALVVLTGALVVVAAGAWEAGRRLQPGLVR